MTPEQRRAFLITALSIVLTGSASAAPIGLTVSNGNLVTVDLRNGASDRIGPLGFDLEIVALDTAPDGTIFGLARTTPTVNSLLQIQRATGEATVIGDVGSQDASTLAFDGTGRLFAADGTTLLEVDPTTAATTPVLDMGTRLVSLTTLDGDLYAVIPAQVSGCDLVVVDLDAGTLPQVHSPFPCLRSADGRNGAISGVDYFSPIISVLIVASYRFDPASDLVEEVGTWSGFPGSNGFVVPTGLTDVGNPSLLPSVEVPALGNAALVLFALILACAALALGRRRQLE